jgi:hypothetical protein
MKRIWRVFQYLIHETIRPVVIFYIVIIAVLALGLSMTVIFPESTVELDGMKLSTVIFLFVVGLNSFKSGYLYLQANGVTRRYYYAGGLIALVAVAAAMTVVDAAYYEALHLFMPVNRGLSPLLYPGSGYLAGFVWTLAFNLLAVGAGWFITMLYYRMGKALKILVSVAVPAILLAGVPIIDFHTGSTFTKTAVLVFRALLGLAGTPNAYIGALSMAAFAAIAFGFCFLLVRRAPVKEQDR